MPSSASSPTLKTSPTRTASEPRVVVNVSLPPDLRDRVARIAIAEGRSFTSLAREALQKLAHDRERVRR
jgi:hypothetical protein